MNKSRISWVKPQDITKDEKDTLDTLDIVTSGVVTKDDMLMFKDNSLNIISGMTGSGKTNLLMNILEHNVIARQRDEKTRIRRIIIMCPTAECQDIYINRFPRDWIISDPDPEIVSQLLDRQKLDRIPTIWIMDDIIGVLDVHRSNEFDLMASSGRHYNLTTIFLMQQLNKVGTVLRDNAATMWITKIKQHCVDTAYQIQSSNVFRSLREFDDMLREQCVDFKIVRFNLTGDQDTSPIVFSCPLAKKTRFG